MGNVCCCCRFKVGEAALPNNTSTTLDSELQNRGFGSQEAQSGSNDLLNASFKYKQSEIKSIWRLKIFIATGSSGSSGPSVAGFQVPGQNATPGGAPNKSAFQEFDLANVITYTRGTDYYAVLHFGKQGGDLWARVEHSGDPAKKLILDTPVFVGVGPDGKSYFVKLAVTFGETTVLTPEQMPQAAKPNSEIEASAEGTKPQEKKTAGGFLSSLTDKVSNTVSAKVSNKVSDKVSDKTEKKGKKKGNKKTLVLKEVYQSDSSDSDSAPAPPLDDLYSLQFLLSNLFCK
jgi:hypothetical protein